MYMPGNRSPPAHDAPVNISVYKGKYFLYGALSPSPKDTTCAIWQRKFYILYLFILAARLQIFKAQG